jgi:hypothetical protein
MRRREENEEKGEKRERKRKQRVVGVWLLLYPFF